MKITVGLIALVILAAVAWILTTNQTETQNPTDPTDFVIYEKKEAWGPCPPLGTCSADTKLYRSGRLITEKKISELGRDVADKVLKLINDKQLMTASCPTEIILDYWATYKISNGLSTRTINFPGCSAEMEEIEALITAAN